MKKSTLLAIIALALNISITSAKADVVINQDFYNTYGYDFSVWFSNHFNKHRGDTVTDVELATVKVLDTREMSDFREFAGVKIFPELEHLIVCSWIPPTFDLPTVYITKLDLSNNKKLKYLKWYTSDPNTYPEQTVLPTYLNIDGLTELDTVIIEFHKLDTLDFSHCPKLKYLSVTGGSALACLKLDGCKSLETLDCSNNQLKTLDLPVLPSLTSLDCSNNKLETLDLPVLPSLTSIDCSDNNVMSLHFTNEPLLASLKITNSMLRSLTIEGCPSLKSFDFSDLSLTTLHIANCENMEKIKCDNGKLETLIISGLPQIESLNCTGNALTELSVAHCENIKSLDCSGNQLQAFSVENTPNLQTINCSHNSFTNLDFFNAATPVTSLDCSYNPFTRFNLGEVHTLSAINFSNCAKFETFPTLPDGIREITCTNSPILSQADLSLYPNLEKLWANNCKLSYFDATKCPNLKQLNLADNHIMEVDLSPLSELSSENGAVNISQKLDMLAIWNAEQALWEIQMPATFDHTRVNAVMGNTLNERPIPVKGTQVQVFTKTFTDNDGLTRFSFLTSKISKGYTMLGVEKAPFFYNYITNSPNTKYSVCTVNVTGHQDPSGVEDVSSAKTVSAVRYYDLQGHESAKPFPGFNIEVTHYTDGTTQSKKIIK